MKASEAREIMLKEGFEYIIESIRTSAARGEDSIILRDMPIDYETKQELLNSL